MAFRVNSERFETISDAKSPKMLRWNVINILLVLMFKISKAGLK